MYEFFVRLGNQRQNVPKWNGKFPHRQEWNRIEMEFEIGTELNADRIALRSNRTYEKFVNTIFFFLFFLFLYTIRRYSTICTYTTPCTNSHQPNEQWTSSEVHNEAKLQNEKENKIKAESNIIAIVARDGCAKREKTTITAARRRRRRHSSTDHLGKFDFFFWARGLHGCRLPTSATFGQKRGRTTNAS